MCKYIKLFRNSRFFLGMDLFKFIQSLDFWIIDNVIENCYRYFGFSNKSTFLFLGISILLLNFETAWIIFYLLPLNI